MKKNRRIRQGNSPIILAGAALLAGVWLAGAQTDGETLVIQREVDPTKVIPVSVSGFTGEVDQALKFDLEVLGFEIVAPDKALYLVTGNQQGQLTGFLQKAKTKGNLLAKSYTGTSPRYQAHAFADDIITLLREVRGVALTRVAFKNDQGQAKEIWVSDYDGHNAQAVTRDGSIAAAPCWVPGQRVLYYNSYKEGFPAIYAHDLNSGTRRPLARHAGSNISPAAGPGGRLAMILSKGGSPNVYVADADGGNLRQLTKSREGDSSPCWSPDGQTVCFSSRREGAKALYLAPAAGGETRRLRTVGVANATEPDWSPDGKWIIFTTQYGNNFELCVVPAEGGEAVRLTPGEDPSWAPNSRTVIFARRAANGRRVLSLLDVPTKRVKDCAPISGSVSQPSWAR